MRRDFVVQISIFSMPRCLGSESPSGLSTGFYVIVVFSVSDRRFVLDFVRGYFRLVSKVWHSFVRKDRLSVMRYVCSPTPSPLEIEIWSGK